MPGSARIYLVLRKIADACRDIAKRCSMQLRIHIGIVVKWLGARDPIAILALIVSLTTLGLSQIPVGNLSYYLNRANVQNLLLDTSSGRLSEPALELRVTFMNNGNEPAAVNAIELFIADQMSLGDADDVDCDRIVNKHWVQLYLYEHSLPANNNPRGTDVDANFGHREPPPLAIPPYNTVQDIHRFSIFNQMNPSSAVNGLLCLDVTATTVNGHVVHRPQIIARINVARGQELGPSPTWTRLEKLHLQEKSLSEVDEQQRNLTAPQSRRMWLYSNFWYWL